MVPLRGPNCKWQLPLVLRSQLRPFSAEALTNDLRPEFFHRPFSVATDCPAETRTGYGRGKPAATLPPRVKPLLLRRCRQLVIGLLPLTALRLNRHTFGPARGRAAGTTRDLAPS